LSYESSSEEFELFGVLGDDDSSNNDLDYEDDVNQVSSYTFDPSDEILNYS
jgi:hypothetical protein